MSRLAPAVFGSDRELAERLVRSAAGIALELRGAGAEIKAGGVTDVVTEADRRAEAVWLDVLREERPGDGVQGEEGALAAGGPRRWLLDPVDGTLNYVTGVPVWCSAVAVLDADGTLACSVYDPVHDELFSAVRAEGATRNDRPLQVAPAVGLADATVTTFLDARRRDPGIARATAELACRAGAVRSLGCGSLELAWIAAGRLHGWLQPDVEPWDWHPGALLVAEAGGATAIRGRWHSAGAGEALAAELLECAADGD
jgi:myo-inositol-1(or 4)-monophosphatase